MNASSFAIACVFNTIVVSRILAVDSSSAEGVIHAGTRLMRNGGGPGGGCASKPVGTYPHLLMVSVGSPIAVPSLTR
jgi:hypothetical protein